MLKNIKNSETTKVLTVVVLLSLGKESTQREYKIAFAENAIVDEHAEAVKVATAAKKSILVLYVLGNTSVFTSVLATTSIIKQKSKQRAKGFYIIKQSQR
jgi:uncharacterized membrane protein YecN with MAPEG domain